MAMTRYEYYSLLVTLEAILEADDAEKSRALALKTIRRIIGQIELAQPASKRAVYEEE